MCTSCKPACTQTNTHTHRLLLLLGLLRGSCLLATLGGHWLALLDFATEGLVLLGHPVCAGGVMHGGHACEGIVLP